MGLETTPLTDFMDLYVFQESQVKARIGWQSLTTREYLKSGKYGLVGGINLVDGKIDWDSIPYVSKWRYDQDKFIQLQQNDVLISKDGTIGKIAFVDSLPFPSTLNSGVYVIRPKEGKYDPSFMYHLLNSFIFEDFIEKLSAGSTISHLYQKDLKHFFVQIPSSLDAQKAITEALSDIDELISLTKLEIIKRVSIREAVINQAFLKVFKSGQTLPELRELEDNKMIFMSRGKVISKRDMLKKQGSYPVYSSSVHNNGLFGEYGNYMFDEELITWSVDGGGNLFYRPKHKFSITNVSGYMRILSNSINPQYLALQLQYQHSKIKFDYTNKAHPSVIRKAYRVYLPEIIDQNNLVERVNSFDNLTTELKISLQKYVWLKQGMMNDLLTGKVRLV